MRDMCNADSDVLLYAKHHYKQDNLWEDLAKILAHRNALSTDYFNKQLIFDNIIHITMDYVKANRDLVCELLSDVQPLRWWYWSDKRSIEVSPEEYDFYEAVVKKCLTLLAHTIVYGDNGEEIIVIDEPDPSILPLSEHSRYNKLEDDK